MAASKKKSKAPKKQQKSAKKAVKKAVKKVSKAATADKMTVLITGAAGFVGSNFLKYLYQKYPNYKFIVLDALTYAGDIKNIPEEIHNSDRFLFWYGNVTNAKVVDNLVSQVDAVVHFAAETHVARSIYDDADFFSTDVLGTQCIANAVLKNRDRIKRFIHISTSEVYGTALRDMMDEEHPLNPQSPYAAAKTGADRLVYSYITTYGLPAVIVRPFNIYGPHQHLEKLIPRFVTSGLLHEPLTVHGTGDSARDFNYVLDVVDALDRILHAPSEKVDGEIFNIATGRDVSINEIADKVLDAMHIMKTKGLINKTPSILNIGDRPGQVYRHTGDATKIQKVLGWKPKHSFESGIKETIDWYVANESWWKNKMWMRHVPIETKKGKIEFH